jgi:hypothetical protein
MFAIIFNFTWAWVLLDIARVLTEFVPLSKLMAEQIGG